MGAGGLGCPVGLYLAAAGIGRLGLVDGDVVERSNLHRQVAHTEGRLGVGKARSLAASMAALNPGPRLEVHERMLDATAAIELIPRYNVIVDATDNVATRYLLSDVCCLVGRPLVSGAALRLDGQLSTYHWMGRPLGNAAEGTADKVPTLPPLSAQAALATDAPFSPCYRCIHPEAPPAASVGRCNEEGVLGPLPGLIGCLQALEVLNMLVYGRANYAGRLLLYSGATGVPRLVRLRGQRTDCAACGEHPSITLASLPDYALFCGVDADGDERLQLLGPDERISADALHQLLVQGERPVALVDVRGRHVLEPFTVALMGSPNTTFTSLHVPLPEIADYEEELVQAAAAPQLLVFVCRRGNDSQRAVHYLKRRHPTLSAVDLIGGIEDYHRARNEK